MVPFFRRLTTGLMVGALALIGAAALAVPAGAADTKVTFLLVNDIYKFDGSKVRGGLARVNAVVKAERAKPGKLIYAHAGDTISPSLMAGFDQGAHMIELFNLAPPDIFVPGNHEFDFGPEVFAKRMAELKSLKLAANLRDAAGKPLAGIGDTTMVEVDGTKIGIVGVALDDTPSISSPGDLQFSDSIKAAFAGAKSLREAGADFVVAVVHLSRGQNRVLQESGAFDLILSGHNHNLEIFFDGRSALVESKEDGEYLTAVDLSLKTEERDGKRRTEWWPNFRVIDTAAATPDPDTEVVVDRYRKDLSQELDVVIAKVDAPLDSRKATVRTGEAAIGNLIADAMRAVTKADAAITNGGGIRGNKQYAAGTSLSRRDVLTELPFGNRTVMIELTGEALQQAIENGVSIDGDEAGRFPQTSGLTIEIDRSKPAGSRVVSLKVGDKPVEPKTLYKVATNDFMMKGGDGYRMFAKAKQLLGERDGKLVANDVMAYLKQRGSADAKVEGRLVAK